MRSYLEGSPGRTYDSGSTESVSRTFLAYGRRSRRWRICTCIDVMRPSQVTASKQPSGHNGSLCRYGTARGKP